YIENATENYYFKQAGVWVLQGNLKGTPGTNGTNCCSSPCDAKSVMAWSAMYNSTNPPVATFDIAYPGVQAPVKDPNIDTYVNVLFTAPPNFPLITPTNPGGLYAGFCLDIPDHI